MLDRLPPSPARQGDIAIYLKAVIDRLNGDLWPHDQQLKQFEQPPLIPAAIECKLRVSVTTTAGEQDLEANVLAEQCQRLVILGGFRQDLAGQARCSALRRESAEGPGGRRDAR